MRKNNNHTAWTITEEHPVTDPIFWGQCFSSVVALLEGWKYAGWSDSIQLLFQSAFSLEKTEVSVKSGPIGPSFVNFLVFCFAIKETWNIFPRASLKHETSCGIFFLRTWVEMLQSSFNHYAPGGWFVFFFFLNHATWIPFTDLASE